MKRFNELAPKTQLTQKVEGELYENRYYHRNFTRTGGIEQAGKIFKEIGLDFTSDAIESLNSVIHKSIKNRKISPNDTLALRIIYLVTQKAAKKWTLPIPNWKPALNRAVLQYEERLIDN